MVDVTAFVATVRRYREFIEHAKELTLEVRMVRAHSLLLELYAGGMQLPEVSDPPDIDSGPSPSVPNGWEGFGKLDWYFEVFDPYEEAPPLTGGLSDDLLDVYRDLLRGLALWDREFPEAAVWEWRFAFHNHWGDHAADALRALHWARKRLVS